MSCFAYPNHICIYGFYALTERLYNQFGIDGISGDPIANVVKQKKETYGISSMIVVYVDIQGSRGSYTLFIGNF